MKDDSESGVLSPEELARAVRAVEPAALLVVPRVLRRAAGSGRRVFGFRLRVPHTHCCWVAGPELLRFARRKELGLPEDHELPADVLLLPRPGPLELTAPAAEALRRYWRLLFHARVERAILRPADGTPLDPAAVGRRIERLGRVAFDEARAVLVAEHLLDREANDRAAYAEFAALYLETRYFEPDRLPVYFPGLPNGPAVEALLAEDVDAEALLRATRPEGVADLAPAAEGDEAADLFEEPTPPAEPSERQFRRWLARADRAEAKGNPVRAAILRTRALIAAGPEDAAATRQAVQAAVEELTLRIQVAFGLADTVAAQWRRVLAGLVRAAAWGTWPAAARLLYDLQTACAALEREEYAIDLIDWVRSLGRRPVRRKLVAPREVQALRRLRSAARKLRRVRLDERLHRRLTALLLAAVHQTEGALRARLGPVVTRVLAESGFRPQNLPEEVAFGKLVGELLDRVQEKGIIRLGDLRDAVARNQVKLPDLRGPGEFLRGDPLLQADARLAVELEGVYRRGEVYLRVFQRLSALAFGTGIGRFLTLFLAVPLGGAFILLEGLQHLALAGLAGYRYFAGQPTPLPTPASLTVIGGAELGAVLEPAAGTHLEFVTVGSMVGTTLFLFAMLHSAVFRRWVGDLLHLLYRMLRGVVVDVPLWVWRRPAVRALRCSLPVVLFRRHLAAPVAFTAVASWLLALFGLPPTYLQILCLFAASAVLFNVREGRLFAEWVADGVAYAWRMLGVNLFPGLYHAVMGFFRWLLEGLDRLIYTVDEWLRFRPGDGRWTIPILAALGLVWFAITYVIRFSVVLFVEPEFNPIKHFPVVTVMHKVTLPMVPAIFAAVEGFLAPLGPVVAGTMAGVVVWFFPSSFFGFLTWELKENWRLYRANRERSLAPVRVGGHGETVRQFLRPGFHSGTLPKLFARLRHAQGASAERGRVRLEEVAEEVRRFVERELLELVHASRAWGGQEVRCGAVRLATNHILVGLECPELGPLAPELSFEYRGDWLVAGVVAPGWLVALEDGPRRAFRAALIGLYKWAGVQFVRDQIEAKFRVRPEGYDFTEEGLIVWPDPDGGPGVFYPLEDRTLLRGRDAATGEAASGGPLVRTDEVLLTRNPVAWSAWVELWERDQAGQPPQEPLLPGWRVLPEARQGDKETRRQGDRETRETASV